jgi:hypothetical protein
MVIHKLVLLAIAGLVLTVALFGFADSGSTKTVCKACDVPEDQWDRLPADKRSQQEEIRNAYEQEIAQRAAPKNVPSAKSPGPPPPAPLPSWPEGIFETGQAPLPGIYQIYNQWQTESDGNHIQVYAGSLKSDAEQGLVVVHVTPHDLKSSTTDVYLTSSKAGPLRIVNAEGQRLTLLSRKGNVSSFDVAARTFSDSQALPAWPSGIFQLHEAPFPAGLPFPGNAFDIVSVWQGVIDGNFVRIFAGSSQADPDQGVAITQTVPLNLWVEGSASGGPESIRLTPEKTGALRLEAVNGGAVSLVSTTGRAFVLDLAQRNFAP